MTLKPFNAWVIYQMKTLKHPTVSFFSHPGEFKWNLSEFWLFCSYSVIIRDKVGKIHPVWWQNNLRKRVKFAHKNRIYIQYFSRNLQCKACSSSVCNRMKHTVEALLGGHRCPPSEFQTLSCRHFGRFWCRCRNFINAVPKFLNVRMSLEIIFNN